MRQMSGLVYAYDFQCFNFSYPSQFAPKLCASMSGSISPNHDRDRDRKVKPAGSPLWRSKVIVADLKRRVVEVQSRDVVTSSQLITLSSYALLKSNW